LGDKNLKRAVGGVKVYTAGGFCVGSGRTKGEWKWWGWAELWEVEKTEFHLKKGEGEAWGILLVKGSRKKVEVKEGHLR